MKVYYSSDLHLEFSDNEDRIMVYQNIYDGDVLVLAGDIVSTIKTPLIPFLNEIYRKLHFRYIIFVPGNHEYYRGEIGSYGGEWITECLHENIHILNPGKVIIEDVSFIGATLWTDFNRGNQIDMMNSERCLNDYNLISYEGRALRPRDLYHINQRDIKFIEDQLTAQETIKQVVVTHHAPSKSSTALEFLGDSLSSSFSSNFDTLIDSIGPDYWIHGHDHSTWDYRIGQTNILANPFGYPHEQNFEYNFQKSFHI